MTRRGTIRNMQTVARELRNNRVKASQAAAQYRVYTVKKNGELYAKPDYYVSTAEEAEAIKQRLEGLNPGKAFKVVG